MLKSLLSFIGNLFLNDMDRFNIQFNKDRDEFFTKQKFTYVVRTLRIADLKHLSSINKDGGEQIW